MKLQGSKDPAFGLAESVQVSFLGLSIQQCTQREILPARHVLFERVDERAHGSSGASMWREKEERMSRPWKQHVAPLIHVGDSLKAARSRFDTPSTPAASTFEVSSRALALTVVGAPSQRRMSGSKFPGPSSGHHVSARRRARDTVRSPRLGEPTRGCSSLGCNRGSKGLTHEPTPRNQGCRCLRAPGVRREPEAWVELRRPLPHPLAFPGQPITWRSRRWHCPASTVSGLS